MVTCHVSKYTEYLQCLIMEGACLQNFHHVGQVVKLQVSLKKRAEMAIQDMVL